jgi:hypothetical protein
MANEKVTISVRRIKEQSFVIYENLYINEPDKILSIQIGFQLGFSIPTNLVTLVVMAYYHYPGSLEPITNIQVQNVFEISNLQKYYVSDTEIKLPPEIISRLVDLSVSHTRALWAKNIAGTVFQENVFPITGMEMARIYFPKMFEEENREDDVEIIDAQIKKL